MARLGWLTVARKPSSLAVPVSVFYSKSAPALKSVAPNLSSPAPARNGRGNLCAGCFRFVTVMLDVQLGGLRGVMRRMV